MSVRTLWRDRARREWGFVLLGLGLLGGLISTTMEGFRADPWWEQCLRLAALAVWVGMAGVLVTMKTRCAVCGRPILVRHSMVTDGNERVAHLSCGRPR